MKLAMAIAALFVIAHVGIGYHERERTIEGTWMWQFEGSQFFETPPGKDPCRLLADRGSWLNYDPYQIYGSYNYRKSYPSRGTWTSQFGTYPLEAFSVRFVGRRRVSILGLGFGHLGGWGSEYEVTRMLYAKPISNLDCRVRYPD